MRRKKLLMRIGAAIFIVVMAVAVGFSSSSRSLISVCGCGNMNDALLADLNHLDTKIIQYGTSHNGIFPTSSEVADLLRTIDPYPYAPRISTDIDVATGNLKITPGRDTAFIILYAVSDDKHSYVLRGIGMSKILWHMLFFGQDLGWHMLGNSFPLIRPGDPFEQSS